ncbi:MAG: hypothetical protein JNM24_05870 [Bdellovibrionaceae bacterium]|nr:hypothetical protein [Pseudobdellovibrionaceae bacterium]
MLNSAGLATLASGQLAELLSVLPNQMNLITHLIHLFEYFGQSSFNSIWQGLGLLLLFLDANVHFLDISI